MKYLLLSVISLLSVTVSSAKNIVENESGCILDLRNNRVVFIDGNDTIQSSKKSNIFYFPLGKDVIINKVLLPDTAKTSHSFKVTSNGKPVGEETQDKKSHDQDIKIVPYTVYTLYWGSINWKICCSDESTKKFDLALNDTTQISIRYQNGEKSEKRTDAGIFELNDDLTINSVKFSEEGLLTIKCNKDTIIQKNVKKIEDNFGLILNKGNNYTFTLEGKTWTIGVEEGTSNSSNTSIWLLGIILGIIMSIISYILFRKKRIILRLFNRSKSLTTNKGETFYFKSKDGSITIGTAASPEGFHTFEDGRSVLVENKSVKLFFPAESLRKTDCDNNIITINRKDDNPQLGDTAYPNGEYLLSDDTNIVVEDYIIKGITKNIKTEEDGKEQVPNTPQETAHIQYNWLTSLTDATKSQLKSLSLEAEDFDTYDDLCSTLAMLLMTFRNEKKSPISQQDCQKVQQYNEDDFIKELITEMKKKRNIRDAFEGKIISNKDELINNIDLLFMKSKPIETSYTLEKLSGIVQRIALPAIDVDLREKVLNVYVRRYLNNKFNLNWDEKTILSNAINGVEIIKSTELNSRVLDIIGNKVGLKFHTLEEFLDAWNIQTKDKKSPSDNVESETISRLQLLANRKKQTISEVLDELENLQSTPVSIPDTEEVYINGRSVDEIKHDLEEYEKIKPLSELTQFGATAEAIKEELSHRGVWKGQTELAAAVKKAVSDAIPDLQVIEPFDNLKKMIEGIHKADTAEKMANSIGRISTIAEDISILQKEKDNALIEKENALNEKNEANALIINEVKTHYHNLFNKDLSSEDSIDAIDQLVEQVGKNITELSQKVIEKNGIILSKEGEIANQKKVLDEKDNEIKTLCEDYSNFIVTAFGQVEKDLVRTCQNARTSDALPSRFIQRVIQNDAFNVSDFMGEMRKIVNNSSLGHKGIITSLRNLFLDTVQSNSWVQTLSHIYLYVQKPEVASYFTKNRIDVGCINASFILTEQMMRALGIELHYPKLFEDTFDSNVYDESTLSDVKDYVSDLKELVGDRQGVIIDMFRLGYTSDGQTHKAKVTRFN